MKTASAPLLCVLFAAGVSSGQERFPRSTPESQGIDSNRLLECVAALDSETENVHSFMLVRHGHAVAEGWWKPYAAEHNHVLYSLSKSFASTAIGIAAAEGKLSIDDPVLRFFPDVAPAEPGWNLKQMRVRDLLSMSTGHQDPPSSKADEITAKSFLAADVPHKPGTHFRYNTAASFMLSAIVEKQTGESLVDYLRPRLFDPLGIEDPVWDTNAQGIALGGYGLRVRTEDIAALGQLYLQGGEWKGRRLLTKEWVAAATSKQVSNGSNPDSDWDQGYGFQFWRCRHGAFRGDGAFGQYCVVLPEQDAAVAITSGLNDLQGVLNILWDKLLPAFHDIPLPKDTEGAAKLLAKLGSLQLPPAAGAQSSPFLSRIRDKTYRFPSNDGKIESLSVGTNQHGQLAVTMRMEGDERVLPCGFGNWISAAAKEGVEPTAGSFAWVSEKVLRINSCAYETPFVTTLELRFEGGGELTLQRKANVGFGGRKPLALEGSVE